MPSKSPKFLISNRFWVPVTKSVVLSSSGTIYLVYFVGGMLRNVLGVRQTKLNFENIKRYMCEFYMLHQTTKIMQINYMASFICFISISLQSCLFAMLRILDQCPNGQYLQKRIKSFIVNQIGLLWCLLIMRCPEE